jgi:hypothetical protein
MVYFTHVEIHNGATEFRHAHLVTRQHISIFDREQKAMRAGTSGASGLVCGMLEV